MQHISPLTSCYLPIAIHRLPIVNHSITFAICGLPIAFHVHCQLPLANHRLLIANHQFDIFQAIIAICHCRFTVSSYQLYTHVFTEGQKATGNGIITNWQIGNWQMQSTQWQMSTAKWVMIFQLATGKYLQLADDY